MPRTRLDNDTIKIKSKIIAPAQFSGMKQFPVDGDGNIIPGIYIVQFYVDYNGRRHSKTKTYDFAYPPEIEKKIVFNGEFPTINHFSHDSDTPTMWNDADLTMAGKTATYEKYVDGALTVSEDVTHLITMNRSILDPAIKPNNYMFQGNYPVLFEVSHTDADGDVVYGVVNQRVLVRELISPSCIDPRNGETIMEGHNDYDIICGNVSRWKLTWEPQVLNQIEVIISDPNNPASFPTTQEMQGTNVKAFLEDLLEGDIYELQYNELGPDPAFPNEMYTRPTTRTYKYEAINLTTNDEVILKPAELAVLNNQLERDIRFISPEMRPTIIREILWEPADITGSIVVQDHQSASVPSEVVLMQNVRAYYINEQGQEEDLAVTFKRPEKANYPAPALSDWFDNSGEVKGFIPKTWNIEYTAQLTGYTTSTEIYAPVNSKKIKEFIIEDTVAPVFIANNGESFPPTQVEAGTTYAKFSALWKTSCDGIDCKPNLYALDYPRHTAPGSDYPYKRATTVVNIMHITEDRDLTAQEFNDLQHGDSFRFKAVATDDSGNSATSFTTVNYVDTAAPVLTVSTLALPINPTPPSEQVLLGGVTTNDASTPIDLVYNTSGINWNSTGIVTVTYTATDAIGLQTTEDRTIILYDPTAVPTGGGGGGTPITCGDTVNNLILDGTENLSQMTDADWTYNFYTLDNQGNQIDVDYVVHTNSKQWLISSASNPDGTIIHSGPGPTPYYLNVDVYYQSYFLHCVTRYIEIQDTIAPTITLPQDPIVITITSQSNTAYVTGELKNALIISDNISTINDITVTIGSLSNSEAATPGTYTKTVRAEDEAGNYTDLSVTFELIITDSDGDGIIDTRDQFPSDPLYTTDIDGDGAGDDDSVVIWHHDFQNTVSYLSVRESEINENITSNSVAQQAIYAEVITGPETAQERSIRMEDGFHISTTNADNDAVSIDDTSLSFTLALEPGSFEIDNSDTGRFIYFEGSGHPDSTNSRLDIKIKKLQQISTGNTVYRFSVYNIREGLSTGANHVFNNSKYSNTTGNPLAFIDSTDLTDYTVLNDVGANELYLGDAAGYEIEHYITNFDLPVDGKLHAYSFAFQKRDDQANGYQIAFFVDGDLKQILFKYNTGSLGLTQSNITYNLYGFDSMLMSDYIWSTMTDNNDIINIHENLLTTTFPASTLNNDDDGDGLTNLTEDLSGVYDKTEANTDANTNAPHYTDEVDDYIERWIKYFATPLSTTSVIGNLAYSKQSVSSEDFSQVDQIGVPTNKEFVNYYNNGIEFGGHIAASEFTIAFWWYNDGSFIDQRAGSAFGTIFDSFGAPGQPSLGWSWDGKFNSYPGTNTPTYGTNNTDFLVTYNDLAVSEGHKWKHFAAVFDHPNNQIKIYIEGALWDTIEGPIGTYSARLNRPGNGRQGFKKWTDFAMWDAKLDQSKITQIYNRGKDLEYDLRNEYPAIVTGNDTRVTGFDSDSVEADYTDNLLTAGLSISTPITGQDVSTTIVNKYDLDAAISPTESSSGTYDIIVETTTNQGIKTYSRREVVVSAPLQGFMEELPFMPSPIGTAINFTSLSTTSEMPVGVSNSNQVSWIETNFGDIDAYVGPPAQVSIDASNFNHITNEFTLSFWARRHISQPLASKTIFTSNLAWTGHGIRIRRHYQHFYIWHIESHLHSSTITFNSYFSDWTHVVITYSFESGLKLYLNGTLSQTKSAHSENRSLDMTDTILIGEGTRGFGLDSFQFEPWELQESSVAAAYALGRTNKILRPPVITLPDENTFVAYLDDFPAQDDPGATAVDFNDDALSWSSDWSTVIGTSPDTGDYVVTYTATDSLGITTTKTRNVRVTVPLKGFMEELPFMPNTLGATAENFTELNGDTALAINGGIVRIPGSNYSHITDAYTISFWFKRTGTGANGVFFKSNDLLGAHEEGIRLNFRQNHIDLQVYSGFQNWQYNQVFWTNWFFPNDSTWHHVAITFEIDASDVCTLKVYRDGTSVFLNTRTFNKRADATALDWSGDVIVKSLANFAVDSFEMVDYVLTETGVNNLVAAGRHTLMSEIAQSTAPVISYVEQYEPIFGGGTYNHTEGGVPYTGGQPTYNKPEYLYTDKHTITFWFKSLDGKGPILTSVLRNGGGGSHQQHGWGFCLDKNDNKIQYKTPNKSGSTSTNSGPTAGYSYDPPNGVDPQDGEWHHIVATWDHAAGTKAIWLDGQRLTGGNDSFTPGEGTPFAGSWKNIRIGYNGLSANSGFTESWTGTGTRYIGNLHIWNTVVSESTVNEIYNAGHKAMIMLSDDIQPEPAGYVTDVEDGNGVITTTSNWATVMAAPAPGIHTVTYNATDSHGDAAIPYELKVLVLSI